MKHNTSSTFPYDSFGNHNIGEVGVCFLFVCLFVCLFVVFRVCGVVVVAVVVVVVVVVFCLFFFCLGFFFVGGGGGGCASRVFDQKGISLQLYRGVRARMVYLSYITRLRYTFLVRNPRYIVEIYHSGRKPSTCDRWATFYAVTFQFRVMAGESNGNTAYEWSSKTD